MSVEKIYVAGHRGMVGSAIVRQLLAQGVAQSHIITRTHADLDLTNQLAVQAFFAAEKPTQVYLAAAKVGFDIAVAQYEKAVQNAFREVADALAARASWERQLQAQTALAQADKERLTLTRLRLDFGAASQLDWLDAQRTAFASQQGLINVQLASLQSQVTLYKALGGAIQEP